MDVAEVSFLSVILTAGSIASIHGCFQLWYTRRHRPYVHRVSMDISTDFLALQRNLNISDLLILLFYVLRKLLEIVSDGSWYGGPFICKGSHFSSTVGLHLSSNTIVSIAIYRVCCARRLAQPNCQSSKSSIGLHLSFVWILALLASLPQLFLWDVTSVDTAQNTTVQYCTTAHLYRDANDSQLQWVHGYQVFHSVSISPIPCGFILVSYSLVAWMLRSSATSEQSTTHQSVEITENLTTSPTFANNNRDLSTTSLESSFSRLRSRRAKRVMKISFLLLFVYICCWLPYNVAILWSILDAKSFIRQSDNFKLTWHFMALSTVLNPWTYRLNNRRQ